MPTAEAFAFVFEQHRRVLRRHAGRLLRGTGLDPDDVLQDVYLRAHAALEGGVVPIEMRAWLLRLVRNACLDELRRARSRPVGEAVLEAVPAGGELLPDAVSSRHEARALLGDIHRLPDRQKSVLVMSAIDGLSHEEVADRLDTTVNTTRSLLARARENLRRTAMAREAACSSVMDQIEEAAIAGVRASELARRHLWSCNDCRAFQRDLRLEPSRLRRLAAWSPWALLAQFAGGGGKVVAGACCALVIGGGAVTVPVVEHHRHRAAPEPTIVAALPPVDASDRPAKRRAARVPAEARPAVTPVYVAAKATAAPVRATERPAKRRRPARVTPSRAERRQFQIAMNALVQRTTPENRKAVFAMVRAYTKAKPGSRERMLALRAIQLKAFSPSARPNPVRTPAAPTPTPTPIATATPSPPPSAEPTPTPTPEPAVPTPSPAPVETPAPTETPTATP